MNPNSMYENHRIAAPEADRYGHVKGFAPKRKIAYGNVSVPIPAHQRVTGSDLNPAIRVRRILAPTDLSYESREAVKYAIHLAEVFGAQLTLLHFYDERWGHASPTGGRGYESMLEEERTLQNKLYALRDEIRKIYQKCNCYFYIGNPSKEIPEVARELNVDKGLLLGHKVSQAMSSHCAAIPGDLTLQELVDDHVLVGGQRCFLIARGQDTVGLITLHRIKEVPRGQWATTTAAEVMLPIEQLKRTNPDAELWATLQQMDRAGVNQLPVMRDSRVIGMLSRKMLSLSCARYRNSESSRGNNGNGPFQRRPCGLFPRANYRM